MKSEISLDTGGPASNAVVKRSAFINQSYAEYVCLYTSAETDEMLSIFACDRHLKVYVTPKYDCYECA